MRAKRPPSYQQCVTLCRVLRLHGTAPIAAAELQKLVGDYATNIIGALLDRGLLDPGTGRDGSQQYKISDRGLAFVQELIGSGHVRFTFLPTSGEVAEAYEHRKAR